MSLLLCRVPFQDTWAGEREKDGQREKQSGFVASSNGKRYCHVHILEAILVSVIPKA